MALSNRQGGVTHTPASTKPLKGVSGQEKIKEIFAHQENDLGEGYTMDDAIEKLRPNVVNGNPDFPTGQQMDYPDAPDQASSDADDIKGTKGYAPRPHVEGTETVLTDVEAQKPDVAVPGKDSLAKPSEHRKALTLGDTLKGPLIKGQS
jgi:hypothetical protein